MKYVKMLGLAAVAAAALMAFVGSSTASATVLCTTQGTGSPTGTTCPANQAEPAGTEIHAINKGVVKLDGALVIECNKSTIKGKTTNEGSATETVVGHIEVLTFEECTCEVKVLKPGSLEVHWTEGTHNGTLRSSGAEVTVLCKTIFGNVHCIFTTNATDVGTLTGGNPAIATANAILSQSKTDSLCPSEPRWTATYEITKPKPLFIAGHT